MTCTPGQQQAIEQLTDIAEASDGDFEIVNVTLPGEESTRLHVRVSFSTKHLTPTAEGFRFTAREGLRISIPSGFPIDRPSVYFTHRRFAGFPHVQWGDSICLYQSSELEWIASDGMFGLVQRLNEWMHAAALGQLDPDDVPLHPPPTYPSAKTRIVTKADAPVFADGQSFWIGTAHFQQKNEICRELTGWSDLEAEIPVEQLCGAAILIDQPLPMEYPDTVLKLIGELEERFVSFALLYQLMRLYALHLKEGEDLYVVVGAPMRRPQPGGPMRQHLSVWRVPADSAKDLRNTLETLTSPEDALQSRASFLEWAVTAKTEWCRVFEDRPEVTVRRDTETIAGILAGKTILLCGCGALGSFVAEFAARAGAAKLILVDNDVVTPGILVRQLYDDRQIGYGKASALKVRLIAIRPDMEVEAQWENLRYGVLSRVPDDEVDLVIDATASRTVSIALENELKAQALFPPIISMSLSAGADYGMVTVRMPEFVSGPLDISRRTKIAALHESQFAHFGKAFWPKADEINLFQPEPGCSEPTFTGSAADIAFHSSALLNIGLERMDALGRAQSSSNLITLVPRRVPVQADSEAAFVFEDVDVHTELRSGYQVLVSPAAKKAIESEILRNRRIRDARHETGGILFGAIDDSLERIYIDAASGPPPDSLMSPQQFECGIEGAAEAVAYQKASTRGSSVFAGIWHTHPVSPPRPSDIDLGAMVNILHLQPRRPRHVVMLIIGFAATRPAWGLYLFRRRDFEIIEVDEEN